MTIHQQRSNLAIWFFTRVDMLEKIPEMGRVVP